MAICAEYGLPVVEARDAAHARELARYDLDFGACAWDIEPGALVKRAIVMIFGSELARNNERRAGFAMIPVLRIEYPVSN